MPVISILNQKGGSGKTTIAVNLAHALKLDGSRVLLVDSDPQGSARDWNEENEGEILPVVGLDRETLPKDLQAIKSGYDWVVIDGAPQIARLAAAAVKASDLVIIPCQPSPYDIWAAADLVDVIKARQDVTDGKPLSAFVVSRAIKNTKLGKEIMEALESYGLPVLKSQTTQRVAYPTTASEGQTVFIEPQSEAAKEIVALKEEIKEFFNGA
ncbi:ParA family partition ATPase [Pleionea litopenaei]|uniref:ParA family partition ATPase n=1 Tax=Pleionea litopenaei TaxID=3070815 RepID=A0AA51X8F3_9GAMM|nr:ParA family partition ATPase [Pleionea sp. HL-JVS1]WMS89296.1 ParA family partition ATPase [Pleionea sp. HL-JVS1]WMS89317.1 ParA family partition ATPase [Pleionea sp. HL-JVS1]